MSSNQLKNKKYKGFGQEQKDVSQLGIIIRNINETINYKVKNLWL